MRSNTVNESIFSEIGSGAIDSFQTSHDIMEGLTGPEALIVGLGLLATAGKLVDSKNKLAIAAGLGIGLVSGQALLRSAKVGFDEFLGHILSD